MIFSRTALFCALAVCGTVNAFSPASPNSLSIAQMVQDSQRFQPRSTQIGSSLDEDDDVSLPDIDSPPADDYIVNVGDLDSEVDENTGIEDDGEPPKWFTSAERVQELRQQFRRSEQDTGSPEYQIAGMTERIAYLTTHLQQNPKDFSTRRGLVALVNKRRRLLNYLVRENEERYESIKTSLGIRHKAPGRVETKEDEYGRFPKQKAVKKHLVSKNKKK